MIDELPGTYSIGSALGASGHGKLLRAVRTRDKLAVTLQLLPIGVTSFAATRVVHPSLAPVIDCGVTSTGKPFLALGELDGESLATRVRTLGPLTGPQVANVASQVANALDALHRAGFTHHCLTTASLFLVGESVLVLDAGLVTTHGAYSALGERDDDPRIDVFALGCIAYELASGEAPIVGAPLGELSTEIPATLRKLIARMADPDPGHRPREAHELARVLALLAGGETAAPLGTTIGAHAAPTIVPKRLDPNAVTHVPAQRPHHDPDEP